MSPLQFYPWQEADAQQWLAQRERFSHAWLIHGLEGIGKVQFAKAGAAALLCEQPQATFACGQCVSCQWVMSGNHPDLRLLHPDALAEATSSRTKNPSKEIRIEQLRALQTWFSTATHRGGYRVVIIYPAEQMNTITANALLKVLEEPPANTVLLLVAHHYERLLPTLLSRCRRLPLATPDSARSVAWLQQQGVTDPELRLAAVGGAPIAAYEGFAAEQPPYPTWLPALVQAWAHGPARAAVLAVAPQLEAQSPAQWLIVLQRLYVDLQLLQAQQAVRYYPGLSQALASIAQRSTPQVIQQQWKWLIAQQRHAQHPLNSQLFVQTALERLAQH